MDYTQSRTVLMLATTRPPDLNADLRFVHDSYAAYSIHDRACATALSSGKLSTFIRNGEVSPSNHQFLSDLDFLQLCICDPDHAGRGSILGVPLMEA